MSNKTVNLRPIKTKLHRPPVPEDHVLRSRLLEQLNQSLHYPLTLISAPAGYGKSTLVSSWLDTFHYPHAWLSLDKNDNDLRMFITYFVAAVETMFPGAVARMLRLLNGQNLPPLADLSGSLINDLDMIKEDFFLVLDDFQHIDSKSLLKMLSTLLRYPPMSMHLIIIGRRDPFLPICFPSGKFGPVAVIPKLWNV